MTPNVVMLKKQALYLKQFITSPRAVGSVMPSSRFLCEAMIDRADWQAPLAIAELGAGEGVLTRALLAKMKPQDRLDTYEIQPWFLARLGEIADSRLRVLPRAAQEMQARYDVIFSCLPLLSLSAELRVRIMQCASRQLNPGGRFIQFQYSPYLESLLSVYFTWQRSRVWLNVPPALVYCCAPR